MKKILISCIVSGTLLYADGLFDKGDLSVGVSIGSGNIGYGTSTNSIYVGVRGDYFVSNSFSIGVALSHWFGDDPSMTEVNIPVTYYFDMMQLHPYIGGFYRYSSFSGDYSDLSYNSVGGRIGFAYSMQHGYAGVGVSAEYNVDTGESRVDPEVFVGMVF